MTATAKVTFDFHEQLVELNKLNPVAQRDTKNNVAPI